MKLHCLLEEKRAERENECFKQTLKAKKDGKIMRVLV